MQLSSSRRPWWALVPVLLALFLAGCSSLQLGYSQLPRLAGWWADRELDLDRSQRAQLDQALIAMMDWHRKEELPRWQALVAQARADLDQGLSEAEWQQLQASFDGTLQRSIEHAGSLAKPLLASLRPQQWQRMQERMQERQADWWKAQQAGPSEVQANRAKQLGRSMARWLGSLSPAQRDLVRAAPLTWPAPVEALRDERAARQSQTLAGLRAWAAGDTQQGNALLLRASGVGEQGPQLTAQRAAVMRSVMQIMNAADAEQRVRISEHWSEWQADLRAVQAKAR
jgi:hypothetical protein